MTAQEIFNQLVESRRGGLSARQFLKPDYERDLCDPWLLPDIELAVGRLKTARDKKQRVCIYGDYDIDGLTATTIMLEACKAWGISAEGYIPSRFTEGYGLNISAIDSIAETGATLIITVDCGSLSVSEVAHAASLGIDVIITDHHAIGPKLPEAVAVINPKRKDSQYPHQDLAGVGVAFKLIQAAQKVLDGLPVGREKWMLDLVAMGTVCDLVPLVGENRALVYFGLMVARKTKRPGLIALSKITGCDLPNLRAEDFGFRLGPRLNASGRLENAKTSLDLLRTDSLDEASKLSAVLDLQNSERKMLQEKITREAIEMAQTSVDDVLVLAGQNWSHGVIGIVAAKVMRQLKKPTIILQTMGDSLKGSGRSFGKYDLSVALEQVRPLLTSGGGHAFAAGFGLKADKLEEFRRQLNDYYASLNLHDHQEFLTPQVDVELPNTDALSIELAELLDSLEPFGQGNTRPIFSVNDLVVTRQRLLGRDGSNCKLSVYDSLGLATELICFNRAQEIEEVLSKSDRLRAIVNLEINRYRGKTSPQLQLIDWKS